MGIAGRLPPEVAGLAEILARASRLGFEPASREGAPTVLGRGFSSIALLLVRRDGHAAVLKLRRLGSKTPTLEAEGRILERIHGLGIAPVPIDYGHDHLLMEHVQGVPLGRALGLAERGLVGRGYLAAAASSTLRALLRLDLSHVDHKEIGDPREHVILRGGDPMRPVIIDFESASIRESPSNVPRFVGGFVTRRLPKILGIPGPRAEEMRRLAREYKRASRARGGPSERALEEILSRLLSILGAGDPATSGGR